MDILLVRHAKSAHDASRWKTDDVRPLAKIGRERQQAASKGMISNGLKFSTIWVSPFKRAQQTLEIIQDHYQSSIEPEVVDELRVWGDTNKVKDMLERHYQSTPDDNLLLVGHNPNMSNLVRLLVGDSISLSTSDVVHIRRSDDGYSLVQYLPRKELMI